MQGGLAAGETPQGGGVEMIVGVVPLLQDGGFPAGQLLAHQACAAARVIEGGVEHPVQNGEAVDIPHPRLAAGVPVGAARLGAQGHGPAGGIVVVAHRPGGANIPAVVVGEPRACPGGVPVVLGQGVPLGDGGRVRVPDRVLGGAAGPRAGRQQQEQRKKAWYEAFHWIVPPRWNRKFCPPITLYMQ